MSRVNKGCEVVLLRPFFCFYCFSLFSEAFRHSCHHGLIRTNSIVFSLWSRFKLNNDVKFYISEFKPKVFMHTKIHRFGVLYKYTVLKNHTGKVEVQCTQYIKKFQINGSLQQRICVEFIENFKNIAIYIEKY